VSNLNDYIGRTVDILAFQGAKPRGETQLQQTLVAAGSGGAIVTGILKLSQRFLIELLTPRGSVPHRPTRGSSFMVEVSSQYIRTPMELEGAFARGLVDVRRNLQAEETADDPLDEQYGIAWVTSVEVQNGNAKIFIAIRSRDPAAVAILPIEVSLA
jgi:hypothetical protein